jgi:hypothetical protein
MLEALWERIGVTFRDVMHLPEAAASPARVERQRTRRMAAPVGMVQLGSLTYSILRLTPTVYGVVRVLDDLYMGTFTTQPTLQTQPEENVERSRLEAVAREAIRRGRTSWVPELARKAG